MRLIDDDTPRRNSVVQTVESFSHPIPNPSPKRNRNPSADEFVFISDVDNSRVETMKLTVAIQGLERELYIFALEPISGRSALRLPMQAAAAATLSQKLAHSNTAEHNAQRAFQLVITDLMGSFAPEAVTGVNVYKIFDEYTRWTEIYLLKTKDGALYAFPSIVLSTAVSGGV